MYTGDLRLDLFINALWMGWNLLLAAVPFLLALYLFQPKQRLSLPWAAGLFLFVLFLPNAAYILTDSIHLYRVFADLQGKREIVMWTGQFFLFMTTGMYLFTASYRRFERFIIKRNYALGRTTFRLFAFTVISIGVYWGRFLRFNSWDALLNPQLVISGIRYLNDLPVLLFVGGFTLFLLGFYFLFDQLHSRLKFPAVTG